MKKIIPSRPGSQSDYGGTRIPDPIKPFGRREIYPVPTGDSRSGLDSAMNAHADKAHPQKRRTRVT